MTVMIGIDPHKASHTAVAVDDTEEVMAEFKVRACTAQTERLRVWATPFPERAASYNATAPIEASSGSRHRRRLNPRGNRQLNWAIHVIAICQLRHPGPGRDYYDRKRADGKSTKEAIRALKRRLSDIVYRTMITDARRAR